MNAAMTVVAQRDEIVFRIHTRVAAKFLVVDFKVGHRAAELTTPAVPP